MGLRPDPILSVSEHADKYRMLSSRSSAEPGRWRTSRTPYLEEIMDKLSPSSPVERVVVVKGSQIGGSEVGNNWIEFIIDYAPGPTMLIQPTLDLARRFSKMRIEPMIKECSRLREKIQPVKAKDSTNTILSKEFPGGILVIGGANSAASLRQMPCRYIFADEIDNYPPDVDGEGDPLELALMRTGTFARRKIFLNSTPTEEGCSRIMREYEQSDMRRFWIPCPRCEEFQFLKWAHVKWPKGEPENAIYICENCKGEIYNYQKTWMLPRGEWRAEKPELSEKVAGFHLPSLYSPVGWFSWGDQADRFMRAYKTPEKLQVFVNTVLGETWKIDGEAPDWEEIYRRREKYPIGSIPEGVVFLTAGVDIQKDRIHVLVVGWGKGIESWIIDYFVITGDPVEKSTWFGLDSLLQKEYERKGKTPVNIRMMAVDSGYETTTVYNWTRRHPLSRVVPVKGSDMISAAIGVPKVIEVRRTGKKLRHGRVKVFTVGVHVVKQGLYSSLRVKPPLKKTDPSPPGLCHFPELGEEFFKELTAERLVKRINKRGFPVYLWEKQRDRNEALDCWVYARAAASLYGIDRFSEEDFKRLDNVSTTGTIKRSNKTRRKSSYWDTE